MDIKQTINRLRYERNTYAAIVVILIAAIILMFLVGCKCRKLDIPKSYSSDGYPVTTHVTIKEDAVNTVTGSGMVSPEYGEITTGVISGSFVGNDTLPKRDSKDTTISTLTIIETGTWLDTVVGTTLTTTGRVLNIPEYPPKDTIPVGKLDTLRVLMLLTSECREDGIGPNPAYGKIGYEVRVRKRYDNLPPMYCMDCPNYWEFVMWLDGDKKKLKDCITVWQSK